MSMKRTERYSATFVIVIVMAVLLAAPAEAAQRYKWWTSDEVQTYLGLTKEQSDDLEEIFQATQPQLKELMQELNREEDELSAIMHAMEVEEWVVTRQIDKVESARSALSKTRILMLYRMHRELTVEQLDGFHEVRDRWRRRDRRVPPGH